MSWRSGCQVCSLLRSLKLPTAASTSRLAPIPGSSSHCSFRYLASQPAASARRDTPADVDSHKARQRGSNKHAEARVSSIYPDSKAADRRNPHAPPLFNHFQRRAAEQSSSKASGQRSSKDAYILRNISTDPELKQLYTSLGRAADTDDAVLATRLCQLIKERKEAMAGPSERIIFEPEEKVVFLAIMRTLAHHGLLEEVQVVHADMLSFGFEECIDSLNHILQAAIISGDERHQARPLKASLLSQIPPPRSQIARRNWPTFCSTTTKASIRKVPRTPLGGFCQPRGCATGTRLPSRIWSTVHAKSTTSNTHCCFFRRATACVWRCRTKRLFD